MKPILKTIEHEETILKTNEQVHNEINEEEEEQQELKIIKPITETHEFETVEEFNEYYVSNKKLFDELTTCKLNKMFKIEGFKITKIKGKVSLKNIPKSRVTALMKIEDLTKRINLIEDRINQIIEYINGH